MFVRDGSKLRFDFLCSTNLHMTRSITQEFVHIRLSLIRIISDFKGFPSVGCYLFSWSTQRDGNQMGYKTCTRWVSADQHVHLFDMKQCRRTNKLCIRWWGCTTVIPADQIPPPGIPNMHCIICLLSAGAQITGFWAGCGLRVDRLNVSVQQVEQRGQRSSCCSTVLLCFKSSVCIVFLHELTDTVSAFSLRLHWVVGLMLYNDHISFCDRVCT